MTARKEGTPLSSSPPLGLGPGPGPGRPAAGRTLRSGRDLVQLGVIGSERAAEVDAVGEIFSTAIPPHLFGVMDLGDPEDPIARQYVPSAEELETRPGELGDPIGDKVHSPVKGIVHRYPDRVLLKPVHACPVYCRFCFRREQVGSGGEVLSEAELAGALAYIRDHREIWEVVITGGDPLILSDRRLAALMSALCSIEHVEVVRIHTRYPVAEPARVTAELAQYLRGRVATYVVLHCNHPRELTAEALAACATLIDHGIPMLSQSVLLRGVNDDEGTLGLLMRAFVRARIKPYYLHHLDLARGTGHFRTSIVEGQALMRALRGRLSGLCQPTYVLDIPGGHGKVPIGPSYLSGQGETHLVEDYQGERHVYRDGAAPASNGRTEGTDVPGRGRPGPEP